MVSFVRSLIAYLSYSGNTEEVAHYMKDKLLAEDIEVDTYEIGYGQVPNLAAYDYIFLGTFTWDFGSTPDEMKDFILELGYKPDNVAVFGTGDTQFGGDDLYCRAVDRVARFYNSKWDGLKIEQSPRGYQEQFIDNWLEGVLADARVIA